MPGKPKLLAGGNPQVAMADGNEPVQAYIAAMPGWKNQVGRVIDTLIDRTLPSVSKAVKWNSAFYGVPDQGWFLSFHCYAKYVKVAFFKGSHLSPLPPVASRQQEVRYLHICEAEQVDESQFSQWVRQASKLPGWGGA